MRVCLVNSYLGPPLEALGHEVLSLRPKENVGFDIAAALDEHGFVPDLLFQQEILGPRVLLRGLGSLTCTKVFWAIDAHLNRSWHRHYYLLFDGIMSPQASRLADEADRFPPVALLSCPGREIDWRPFAERSRDVGFIGRLTEHRLPRMWLMDILRERYRADIRDNVPLPEMFAWYQDTRLAPNEAICHEANFRLVEAASTGALVVSHDAGPDQEALYTPGEEIVVYEHALELIELIDFFRKRPDSAEKIGRRAWERTRREHLIGHRARAVLDFAATLSSTGLDGQAAKAAEVLTLAHISRQGVVPKVPAKALLQLLGTCEPTPEVMAERIRLLVESGTEDKAMALIAATLDRATFPADIELNLAGSMAALRYNQMDLARQHWFRMQERSGQATAKRPETVKDICLLWAGALRRAGRAVMPGAVADPQSMLPQTAFDCLNLAKLHAPTDVELMRQTAVTLGALPGLDYMRLGFLSEISLHRPTDWRMGLELGFSNLRVNRMVQGVEEILAAREVADRQGKREAFDHTLAGRDPGGLVQRALEGYTGP